MTNQFKQFLMIIGVLCVVGLGVHACRDQAKAGDGEGEDRTRGAPRKELNLSYTFEEGWLMSHDFYVRNTSGEDLSEVHLRFTFVGENASPTIDRYWANLSLGAMQQITFPVERVSNIQRITVSGLSFRTSTRRKRVVLSG